MFQLKKTHEDLRDSERLLSESRQQAVVLEDQLETSQETVERLEGNLDNYKLKYSHCTEEISRLEETFAGIQRQLIDSKERVSDQ